MSKKVVTFGEIMLRLSTPGYLRFIQAQSFDATYGGGEANVAVSLAQLGVASSFVSKVPDNPLGQSAINHLQRYGVNTGFIKKGGKRLGIYFLETGASQRPSIVVYDRADSAIAGVSAGDFDWQEVFRDAGLFHFTGITPALSDACSAVTLEACRAAKAAGVTVSCDLNYRKKLWSQQRAREVMSKLMPHVDIAIANEEDAEKIFGLKAEFSNVESGVLNYESYREVARQLLEMFNFRYVAMTLRESISASDNGWSGLLYDGRDCYLSRRYDVRIIDRVGGGDSFGAGLIYALLHSFSPQDAIEFAVAASCLKHSIHGDCNLVSVSEIKSLVDGDGSGRVQR